MQMHVQVYRINDLQDSRHLYKIDINAVENHLTGVCVTTTASCSVVVVEGDSKGIRRFNRLMLHRIDWNPLLNADGADDDMFEEPNKCYLVWKGIVTKPTLSAFSTRKFLTEEEARAFMAQSGVAPYWDAARSFLATAHMEADDLNRNWR
jgi:U4/U6 small nuclear ribonucleoprotein PRP3